MIIVNKSELEKKLEWWTRPKFHTSNPQPISISLSFRLELEMKLINRIVYPGKIAPYEMGPMGLLGHVRYIALWKSTAAPGSSDE